MDKQTISEAEIKEILSAQPQLSTQSFETLKGEISPVTLELMSRQATINIGKKLLNQVQSVMSHTGKRLLSELFQVYTPQDTK
jgi:hypothetical protein